MVRFKEKRVLVTKETHAWKLIILKMKPNNKCWERVVNELYNDDLEEFKEVASNHQKLQEFINDFEAVEDVLRPVTKREVLSSDQVGGSIYTRRGGRGFVKGEWNEETKRFDGWHKNADGTLTPWEEYCNVVLHKTWMK